MRCALTAFHLGTECAGHATDLAHRAVADRRELVIAAGGDGTIHEVAHCRRERQHQPERKSRQCFVPCMDAYPRPGHISGRSLCPSRSPLITISHMCTPPSRTSLR